MIPEIHGHAARHCPVGVAYFDGRPVCYSFDDSAACPWPASQEDKLAYALQPGRLVVRELGREVWMEITADLLRAIASDVEHQRRKVRIGN